MWAIVTRTANPMALPDSTIASRLCAAQRAHLLRLCLVFLLALVLAGCASTPRQQPSSANRALGERIAAAALTQVGKPYRYGGSGPDAFDCSGLVQFAYTAHGVRVPRTTAAQFAASTLIRREHLTPGDLLFFRFDNSKKVTHVGIYVGDGRFVHAPQGGRTVEVRRVDEPWYERRLAGTGRLY